MKLLSIFALLLLLSCKKESNTPVEPVLKNTVWVMDQYMYTTAVNPTPINDTLDFYEEFNYKLNKVINDYSCSSNVNGTYTIVLYNTSFGNITGILPNTILSTPGQLQIQFSNIQTNKKIFIWIRKI